MDQGLWRHSKCTLYKCSQPSALDLLSTLGRWRGILNSQVKIMFVLMRFFLQCSLWFILSGVLVLNRSVQDGARLLKKSSLVKRLPLYSYTRKSTEITENGLWLWHLTIPQVTLIIITWNSIQTSNKSLHMYSMLNVLFSKFTPREVTAEEASKKGLVSVWRHCKWSYLRAMRGSCY